MNEERWSKYGAATGIVFVVLFVIGFLVVFPTPPDLDSPVDEWSRFYVDEQDAIRAAVVMISVSLGLFIWFLGSLASGLRAVAGSPRLPTVAFAGGMLVATFFLVALTATGVAAYRPDEVSPELTRAINDVTVIAGVPAIAGFGALFGATALVILRSGGLPGWLGWLSAIAAVVQPLTFGALFTTNGEFAGDGALGLFVPFVLFVVTILALSVVLVQHAEELAAGGGGIADRIRGAVTGAAAGAQAGARGERPPGSTQ